MLSLNALLFIGLGMAAAALSYHEDRKEKTSARSLTADQLKTFNESYSLSRPATDYPADLQTHAAIAHPARIRKIWAVIAIATLLIAYVFTGP
ncbi:MAG: hypothetical protein RIB61_15125 [Roseicyclus sp.]|jgi:hypothetical protein